MDTALAPIPIAARLLMMDAVPATARAPAADRRSRPTRTSTDARGLTTDAAPATARAPAADRRSRPARISTDARGLMTDAGPVTVRVPTADRPAVPNPATVAAPAPSRAFQL